MKNKSSDVKLNPGYKSSGSSGAVTDRQLIQRVEQASQSILDDGEGLWWARILCGMRIAESGSGSGSG